MNAITQILGIAVLVFLLDIPWLWVTGQTAGKMFAAVQKQPMRIRWDAAVPVYIALAWLLTRATGWRDAAALGFAVYAVYDFTNLATLANYDAGFAVADSIWGGVLFAISWTVAKQLELL